MSVSGEFQRARSWAEQFAPVDVINAAEWRQDGQSVGRDLRRVWLCIAVVPIDSRRVGAGDTVELASTDRVVGQPEVLMAALGPAMVVVPVVAGLAVADPYLGCRSISADRRIARSPERKCRSRASNQ